MAEKVARVGVSRDNNFIYFLDKDGDVARAKRAVGGQKRKAKKAAKPKARAKAKAKAKPKKAGKKKGKRR